METADKKLYPIIVVVGKVKENFDKETGFFVCENCQDEVFKYVVIHNPELGEEAIQLLIFKEHEPYSLHAEAVYVYMKKNNINGLVINGGGRVKFSKKDNESFRISFYGDSGSFKNSSVEDFSVIISKLKEVFTENKKVPEIFTLDVTNRKSFKIDGKSFSKEEILEEIKQCSKLVYMILTLPE